jgi:hypothetical protein
MIRQGDNFKVVTGELATSLLAEHFAAHELPLDLLGPRSLLGDVKPTAKVGRPNEFHRDHRNKIRDKHIARFCRVTGLERPERDAYRDLIRRTGLPANEAMRIILAERGRK